MQPLSAQPFARSVHTEIDENYHYQRLTPTDLHCTIRELLRPNIIDIRTRQRCLRVSPRGFHIDPNNSYSHEPLPRVLNRLLDELKVTHAVCRGNRGLVGLQNEVNRLARQIIRRMHVAALRCFNHMTESEIEKMIRRGGLSEGIKDRLLFLIIQKSSCIHRMETGPVIQPLIEMGANIHRLGLYEEWESRGRAHRVTLLEIATKHQERLVVDYLLSIGANPRARNDEGRTAASFYPESVHIPLHTFFAFRGESRLVYLCAYFLNLFTFTISVGVQRLEAAPVLHAALLAPLNTALCEVEETRTQDIYAVACAIEGMMAASYMTYNIVESQPMSSTALLYATLWFLSHRLMERATFNTVAINYISPIAKIANIANAATVFSLDNPINTAIPLALYTISLLDSYGRLPTPLQKIYYLGLRMLITPFDLIIQRIGHR